MAQTKVLVYGLDPLTFHGEKVQKTLEAMGAELVYIKPEHMHSKMGALAGLEGYEIIETEPPATLPEIDYLLFCTDNADDLDPFMHAMKVNNAQVGAKGVLTDQNKDWPFIELVQHVAEEHHAMEKFFELSALTQEITHYLEIMKERSEQPDSNVQFPQMLSNALYIAKDQFLPEKEPVAEDLEQATRELRAAYYAHNGRRQFVEPIHINVEKNESTEPVTYDLSVVVEGYPQEDFKYRWNDGSAAANRLEVPASELNRLSVTVYALNELHGVRKDISLNVPNAPQNVVATLEGESVKLTWEAPEKKELNCPDYVAYLVRFDYPNDSSSYFEVPAGLTSLNIGFQDAGSLRPSGYHVAAVNIVGRSDFATARIRD